MNYLKLIGLLACVGLSSCLYEDQIGKFDWKQKYIGQAKFAYFDPVSPDEVIIATEENTLASVRTKTGELNRRAVLESDARGEVLLLQGPTEHGSHLNREYDILTVTGRNPSLVRGWNAKTFSLEFEWALNLLNPSAAGDVLWFYDKHFLYHVIPVWGSHIELVTYIASSGETTKSTASKISATWTKRENCRLAGSHFVCLVKNQVLSLNLLVDDVKIKTVAVDAQETDVIEVVHGQNDVIRIRNQIVLLKQDSLVVRLKSNADSVTIESELGDNGALIEVSREENVRDSVNRSTRNLHLFFCRI